MHCDPRPYPTPLQVFVGSALEGTDAGVTAVKAWAVDKLPEGPTLYPKVWTHSADLLSASPDPLQTGCAVGSLVGLLT